MGKLTCRRVNAAPSLELSVPGSVETILDLYKRAVGKLSNGCGPHFLLEFDYVRPWPSSRTVSPQSHQGPRKTTLFPEGPAWCR